MCNQNLDIIEQKTSVPRMKHLQLVDYINSLIEDSNLQIGVQIPSTHVYMSEENLLRGLNYVSELGKVEVVYLKGYFVKKISINQACYVFLLLDKNRGQIYHSIFGFLKDMEELDIDFQYLSYKILEPLFKEKLDNNAHYIIDIFLKEGVVDILYLIPPKEKIIIEHDWQELSGNHSYIYQDYSSDIYCSFLQMQDRFKNYEILILIMYPKVNQAQQLNSSFLNYCVKNGFLYSMVLNVRNFCKGNVYIAFSRYDMNDVVPTKLVKTEEYEFGKDVGLISYIYMVVKYILENSITMIVGYNPMQSVVVETRG